MYIWRKYSNDDKDIPVMNSLEFNLKGQKHEVSLSQINPKTTLNDYLRQKVFFTGTKRMCLEGGCGACVVAVKKPNESRVMAVNSCLVSILTCHGWKIDTIEGIGGPLTGYNPIQQALATFNGTQCGFCSPGMVMNMYALCSDGKPTMQEVENSFGSNICRCTGYRPILSAFKALSRDASKDLLGDYPDIEDFVRVERPTNEKYNIKHNSYCFKKEDYVWIKALKLKEVLKALSKAKAQEPYMLVSGNTAKGVYKFPTPKLYIDICDVEELTTFDLKNNALTIGANMTLTNTLNLFRKSSNMAGFAYFKTIADHLDLVAHVPVRNIGTLAGNLMMKHYRNEFPSDVFLLLELFSAQLIIVDTDGNETKMKPSEFLKYDMNKKILKYVILKGLSEEFKYETFKIMPRAQNAHALVNAGILVKLDPQNITQYATIVFGNINPKFVHAIRTEKYLLGKNLFCNETLQGAFEILEQELETLPMPPEPQPEFRKRLAISLFYKAVLKISPTNILSTKIQSGGSKLSRPLSNGLQEYGTNKSLYPLTKPIPKLEALAQTSGQAEYIDDIPNLPYQLHGKFILAKSPAGSTIDSIDSSKALAIDGVVKVFTKTDIPGENNFMPNELKFSIVERIFCDGEVQYYDQPVGLVVATDPAILNEAVGVIEIKYTPPKSEPLLTIRDVLSANIEERIVTEDRIPPKKIGSNAKHTLQGKFDLESQYHFHMELQCCLAIPSEDSLTLYPSTQWMDLNQLAAAKMLGIPQNKVRVFVKRCGGAFGAKINRGSQISCAAALAAWLLKKPVRITLSLKENMGMIGKRCSFAADYNVTYDDSGTIQHFQYKCYEDHGAGGNDAVMKHELLAMLTANYNNDPMDLTYYRVTTDKPANTWTRAPGSIEALAFVEYIMDTISYELGIDPIDVRINNITTENKLLDYLGQMKEWADIDSRKVSINDFNQKNRWKKKGISVVPMAFKHKIQGPYTITISIYHGDGSVTITHGGIEIGQGINTKAAQLCAYQFNIPLEKVNVYQSNSVDSANSFLTGASMTTEAICYGVLQASDELLRRMKPYREENTSQTWLQLVQKAYKNSVFLSANAQSSPKSPFLDPYTIYGCCASEVEVDILTGQHQITRVDLIEDAGTSLSPLIDIGQVEGAFIMGLGYFTTEKLVYAKDGRLLSNNTWYYKPPGAKDIPIDFRVKLPERNPNPVGLLQSKAIGEPPMCLSVSIPLAIRQALASARQDANPSNPKYYPFNGPTTVENTFMNSLNDFSQFTL